jgi:hypothetical protein
MKQVYENKNPKLITRFYTQKWWSGNPDSTHVEYDTETKMYRFFNLEDEGTEAK